jgi:hypothetical protein
VQNGGFLPGFTALFVVFEWYCYYCCPIPIIYTFNPHCLQTCRDLQGIARVDAGSWFPNAAIDRKLQFQFRFVILSKHHYPERPWLVEWSLSGEANIHGYLIEVVQIYEPLVWYVVSSTWTHCSVSKSVVILQNDGPGLTPRRLRNGRRDDTTQLQWCSFVCVIRHVLQDGFVHRPLYQLCSGGLSSPARIWLCPLYSSQASHHRAMSCIGAIWLDLLLSCRMQVVRLPPHSPAAIDHLRPHPGRPRCTGTLMHNTRAQMAFEQTSSLSPSRYGCALNVHK